MKKAESYENDQNDFAGGRLRGINIDFGLRGPSGHNLEWRYAVIFGL
jgi:hypothetical protein